MPVDLRSERLQQIVRGLGVSYALVLLLYFLASPFLAAVAPFNEPGSWAHAEGAGVLFASLPLPEAMLEALRGKGVLTEPLVFGGVYALLLCFATLHWIGAIVAIHKYRDALTMSVADRIMRWSIVFIAIVSLATPVQVHDFWMSVAWGRAVADGLNPYYSAATDLAGLPLSGDIGRITYGPLWAVISGATAWIAGNTALGTALLSKLILGAAWMGVVYTVRALMRDRNAAEKCMALLIVGWAPVALINGVADGHNDSMMVLPMLLWILYMERGRLHSAGAALGASIAVKYVTLPFLALHIIRGLSDGKAKRGPWLASVLVALTVALGMVALFYRSPEFFDATVAMQSGKFFTPATLLDDAVIQLGLSRPWLPRVVDLLILSVAGVMALRELRSKSTDGFRAATLWTMSALLLGVVGHVWPWFVLWVLGLAAIQPARRIAWFAVGMAAAAPFILIPWTINPELAVKFRLTLPGILLYGCGAAAVLSAGAIRRFSSSSSVARKDRRP